MADAAFRLTIGLERPRTQPPEGAAEVGRVAGGPEELLIFLENTLGLRGPDVPLTERVLAFMRRLDTHPQATWRASLTADRWATTTDLLRRRDDLKLAGWDPDATPDDAPRLLQDLAHVEQAHTDLPPGLPERVAAVAAALDDGRRLPPHRIELDEAADEWPPRWREILQRLDTQQPPTPEPAQGDTTALGTAQRNLLHETDAELEPDATLRVITARSLHTACDAVAAWLAAYDGNLRRVTIHTPDPVAAQLLDATLARRGVPTTGAPRQSTAQPVFQVLPLALQLCWQPVNPFVLLDFLLLPRSPIPRAAAYRLARSLEEQPGYASAEWQKAVAHVTDPERDPDGRVADRIRIWLDDVERQDIGRPLPVATVAQRCRRVAQWAAAQTNAIRDHGGDPAVRTAFDAAAAQAKALGDAAAAYQEPISGPQLRRLLDAVQDATSTTTPHPAQADGPVLAARLADVAHDTDVLLWLSLTEPEPESLKWTPREAARLRRTGIEIPDPARRQARRSRLDRHAIARARRLVAIRIPEDASRPAHPVWLQLEATLPDDADVPLDAALAGLTGLPDDFAPPTADHPTRPAPPTRTRWHVDEAHLTVPDTFSATQLEDRLACPLKWYLRHVARIRPSPAAAIPEDFLLKGNFAHQLLAEAFGDGGPMPPPDDARERIQTLFDAHVGRDAAPLAQPHKLRERVALRRELGESAAALARVLAAGGYKPVGMEVPLEADIEGRTLTGKIDCVVAGEDGEAVIDFKYGGLKKYREKVETGRATQLAVYAHGRATQTGKPVTAAAYLVLAHAQFYTPEGSPLRGVGADGVLPGDAIHTTWDRFEAAVEDADQWLREAGPIEVRPLLDATQWPEGAKMVLEEDLDEEKEQECCRYCDYATLCGLKGVT